MNAMRADLVEEAAADGVDLYLTGQVRAPGRGPAERLGIGVVAIGHRRSELWGLRQLGRELEEAFPGLVARVLGPARGPNGRAGW
jgi:putative NIF3 family GTP cyclohydrolase 1 type 2